MKITYADNSNRKVYNIDFDGTLTDGSSYENLVPNKEMVIKVKELYFTGHIVIVWSARLWADAPKIASWLILHGIGFHGLMLGKGGSDCYVDDKAIHADDFLNGAQDETENKSS